MGSLYFLGPLYGGVVVVFSGVALLSFGVALLSMGQCTQAKGPDDPGARVIRTVQLRVVCCAHSTCTMWCYEFAVIAHMCRLSADEWADSVTGSYVWHCRYLPR